MQRTYLAQGVAPSAAPRFRAGVILCGIWSAAAWACIPGEAAGDGSASAGGKSPASGQALGSAVARLSRSGAVASAASPSDAGVAADAGARADVAASPSNDCCTSSGSGGCRDDAVLACVCAGDSFCCTSEYDALCVNQAVSRCGIDCDDREPVSDCCGPSDVPGCTQPGVAACICDIDPFCCAFRFDPSCVNLGVSRCGAACEEEP